MAEGYEEAEDTPGAAERPRSSTPSPTADRERVILLECRMEQIRSRLEAARADADHARTKLAEAAAREADHARRHNLLHEELADAREEVAALHQRLERSEALRAELEGQLFDTGENGEAEELVRLRRELFAERHRAMVNDRTLARMRARVEELLSSRETLLTRVAEWQELVREDGPEAADLSEYLSALRGEILELEQRSSAGEGREAALRERLARAGVDPDFETGEPPRARALAEPIAATPLEEASEGGATTPSAAEESDERERPVHEEQSLLDLASAEADRDAERDEVAADEEPIEAAADDLETSAADVSAETSTDPDRDEPVGEVEPAPAEPDEARETTEAAEPAAASAPETRALEAALSRADLPAIRSELSRCMERGDADGAREAIRPWTEAGRPPVRAAAFEALGRLLERDPETLASDLQPGLADADARVRRRVALAAATARGLDLRALLGPLAEDPDPQVRRVVREVLRHAPPAAEDAQPRTPRPTQRLAPSGTGP